MSAHVTQPHYFTRILTCQYSHTLCVQSLHSSAILYVFCQITKSTIRLQLPQHRHHTDNLSTQKKTNKRGHSQDSPGLARTVDNSHHRNPITTIPLPQSHHHNPSSTIPPSPQSHHHNLITTIPKEARAHYSALSFRTTR